jgi:hypothetical protein
MPTLYLTFRVQRGLSKFFGQRTMKILTVIDYNALVYPIMARLEFLAPSGNVLFGKEREYTELVRRLVMACATTVHPEAEQQYWSVVTDAETYFRSKLCPGYKGKRPPKPSCFQFATQALRHIPHHVVHDFEADDLLARAVAQHRENFDRIYIWTIDSDIYQLVDEKVHILLPKAHNPEFPVITPETCKRWFTMKVLRRATRTRSKETTKYWKCQHKKEYGSWLGDPYRSICHLKYTQGDTSDNYSPRQNPIIFDLKRSPIHATNYNVTFQETNHEIHQHWVDSLKKVRAVMGLSLLPNWWEYQFVPYAEENTVEGEFGWH